MMSTLFLNHENTLILETLGCCNHNLIMFLVVNTARTLTKADMAVQNLLDHWVVLSTSWTGKDNHLGKSCVVDLINKQKQKKRLMNSFLEWRSFDKVSQFCVTAGLTNPKVGIKEQDHTSWHCSYQRAEITVTLKEVTLMSVVICHTLFQTTMSRGSSLADQTGTHHITLGLLELTKSQFHLCTITQYCLFCLPAVLCQVLFPHDWPRRG